jgi:3-dehydroquinate dehydratase
MYVEIEVEDVRSNVEGDYKNLEIKLTIFQSALGDQVIDTMIPNNIGRLNKLM